MSGVRQLLGGSSNAARDSSLAALLAPPRMPNVALSATSEPPLPAKVRRATAAPPAPPSCNTTAIRINEIRTIAEEVAARESAAKRASRLHAVAIRAHGSTSDESAVVLRRMFPHLVRQSPVAIATRVLYFLGYVALGLGAVGLRALRQTPRLATQARDGLRAAWMRAAFRNA